MIAAILRQASESSALTARVLEAQASALAACAGALAERYRRGGRLFAMGNGGSACDAQHVAVEFQHPIVDKRPALPALALPGDTALLTAIGNDSDFARVFSEPLALGARSVDAALGISTSGASSNVLRGLACARERGLLTIGFAGRDGGRMLELCDHAFVVPSWSAHRIQEVHTVLVHLLWDSVHLALGADDVL